MRHRKQNKSGADPVREKSSQGDCRHRLLAGRFSNGAGLIEIIVGTAIISLSLIGVVSAFNLYVKAGLSTTTKLQAGFLAEEGIEAMRSVRDRSWSEFSGLLSGTNYQLSFANSRWEATTTGQLIDAVFTRTILIEDVYRRNSDDDIISATSTEAKTLDPSTKKVTVTVSWGSTTATHLSFEEGTTDGDLANFPSNNAGSGDAVQSFTISSQDISVNSVELFLKRVSGTTPSELFLEIRSGSSVGTVLAVSNVFDPSTLAAGPLSWVGFSFPSLITLSANTQYYLRLTSNPLSTVASSGSFGTINWGYKQTASSPYAGGSARRYVGRLGNENDQGQELSQYDFSFRIKRTANGGQISAVTYLTNLFE